MALSMKPEPFSREVDRLFDAFFGPGAPTRENRRWVPPMDLLEADDHFLLKADLPGLAEDDVSIEVQDNALTISGERRGEHEEHGGGWFRMERAFGSFSRSLTLPEGIDAEAIDASFEHGVLSVRIPKPEERKPRRITISAGNGSQPKAVEGTAKEK